MEFDKRSFASAETLPVKVFINEELWKSCIQKNKIIPIHLQLNPTNKCKFRCSYCSCKNRDIEQELDINELKAFLKVFKQLGGQAVTVTGGGEPLEYTHVNEMFQSLYDLGILIGLVTNGTAWRNLDKNMLSGVIWCRVSASDELPLQLARHKLKVEEWLNSFSRQIFQNPKVDWAVSYVMTHRPNIDLIAKIIDFANSKKMTHVRVVSDILQAEKLDTTMEKVKAAIEDMGINTHLVNWQGRSTWVKGQRSCWLSIAKPLLAADGYLYPCCGTQYALEEPTGDYPLLMRFGHMKDFSRIVASQQCFNGLICEKCYYQAYNIELDAMKNSNKIKHKEHI